MAAWLREALLAGPPYGGAFDAWVVKGAEETAFRVCSELVDSILAKAADNAARAHRMWATLRRARVRRAIEAAAAPLATKRRVAHLFASGGGLRTSNRHSEAREALRARWQPAHPWVVCEQGSGLDAAATDARGMWRGQ